MPPKARSAEENFLLHFRASVFLSGLSFFSFPARSAEGKFWAHISGARFFLPLFLFFFFSPPARSAEEKFGATLKGAVFAAFFFWGPVLEAPSYISSFPARSAEEKNVGLIFRRFVLCHAPPEVYVWRGAAEGRWG